MTRIAIALPEDLARKARAAGLLKPNALKTLLEEELRRQKARNFLETADKLAGQKIPVMSANEIQSVVEEVRQEIRSKRASRS